MKTYIIGLFLLAIGTVFAQPTEDELKLLWNNEVQALVKLDRKAIRTQCASYIGGEWGWVIGLEKNEDEWSVEDFLMHVEEILDAELRENLQYGDPSMIEVVETDEGYELQIAIFSSFEEDGEIYESAVFIIYTEEEGKWKLSAIRYAG